MEMAKNKKSKQSEQMNILQEYDQMMNTTYDDLLEEIQDMQLIIAMEDRKIMKKAKKSAKKGKNYYNVNQAKREVRDEVLGKMENTNFLTRIQQVLSDLVPVVKVIARLVASLILSILSIDLVKVNISKPMLEKMNNIYNAAMGMC